MVVYREYYGMQPGKPNVGLKLPAEEVAREIVRRETAPSTGRRESVAFGVLDPAAFAVISGPSIAETLLRHGIVFRRADNSRVSIPKKMGGVGTALASEGRRTAGYGAPLAPSTAEVGATRKDGELLGRRVGTRHERDRANIADPNQLIYSSGRFWRS